MNIARHPELVERLAAAYALGTLRGPARRRFEALARQHPAVRAAVLKWESHWSGLTEIQVEETPSPAVWSRIHNLVQAETVQTRASVSVAPQPRAAWWHSWRLWQGTAFASVVIAAFVWVSLGQQQQSASELAKLKQELQQRDPVVAVLSDGSANAQLLISFNSHDNALQVERIGDFRAPDDRDLQLWGLPLGQAPVSLGVLARQGMIRVPLQSLRLAAMPTLAVSLEPLGGVPGQGGPTGPVIFKGSVIRKDT